MASGKGEEDFYKIKPYKRSRRLGKLTIDIRGNGEVVMIIGKIL